MTGWSTLKKLIWLRIIKGGGSALRTVTGAIVHVTNALAMPAKALTVNVEPIQAGSGDPSPDNVRPISGRTSATVTRTGKNLFDINTIRSTANGMTVTIDGQTVKVDGTSSASGRATLAEFQFLKAGTYHLHTSGDLLWIKAWSLLGADATVTVDDISVVYRLATATLTSGTEYHLTATENQIEIGSSFSAYEPYQGNIYTIQLGDTVYGGTLDVTQGKMVVDRAYLQKRIGDMDNTDAAPGWKSSGVKDIIGAGFNAQIVGAICSAFSSQFIRANTNGVNDILFFPASGIGKTQTELIAAMPDLTVDFVIPLATPFEITLTPTQIDMLLGENNLWADAGDSTLTYYAEGEASTSEALGILLGGTYNNPGGADDVSDDEALGILLGGS